MNSPDEARVAKVVARMLLDIDRLDWPAVGDALADEVDVDYTSLFGGVPARLPRSSLVATWKELVPGFEATQHLIGPVVVTMGESGALAETAVRGYHRIKDAPGGESWMVAGRYEFAMVRGSDGWLIGGIHLIVSYQEGNGDLPAMAKMRAAQAPRTTMQRQA